MNEADALVKYRQYVSENPGDADGARKNFYDTFGVDPEQGPVAAQAAIRLRNLPDPNAPAPAQPGLIQRGLGTVVGDELAARMTGEAPGMVGLLAMAMVPEMAIPKAAAWGPKMLAFVKGAAGRVLAGSAAGGAATLATTESPKAAAQEALTQAKYGVAGEAIGLGVQTGAKLALKGGRATLNALRGTAGGQMATKEMAGAIAEHANNTVNRIVNEVSSDIHSEVLGADVGQMVKKFDRIAGDAALELYEVPKQIARETRIPPVDIKPIAKDLIDIVKADERAGGFMSPIATQEERAAAMAGGSRTAMRKTEPLADRASRVSTQTPLLNAEAVSEIENIRQQIEAILKAGKATVPALINIRGKVSQIMADVSAPDELRLVAKRIDAGRLDKMIGDALDAAGPGGSDTWKAAVNHYAETAAIKEQALYKLAKKSPEMVEKYVTPQRPDTVTTLKKLAQYSDMKDLIPNVQRKFLEARLAKGVENFGAALDEYGPKTVDALFSDPKGAAAVRGLKELGEAVAEKMNAIGAGPESVRQNLLMALGKNLAGGSLIGSVSGYRATHTWEGGAVGGLIGGTAGLLAPYQLVKMAASPGSLRRTTALLKGLSKDSTPATFDALSRTIKRAMEENP